MAFSETDKCHENQKMIDKYSEKYVIITPCYNEEEYIVSLLRSVVAQTVKPKKWIIVDDGSTDKTAVVIKEYVRNQDWIEYLYHNKLPGETYYSSNVYALLAGYQRIVELESKNHQKELSTSCIQNFEINNKSRNQDNIEYDFIAILDADIELCPKYYEKIFEKFNQYPELGIATGTFLEKEGEEWIEARIDRRSTPKAIQVFRRKCYEQCGGYIPFKYGGEDSGMEIMARMNGWQTWSFNDNIVKHNRPVGTGDGRSQLKARYRMGFTDYSLATHPLFMVFKCIKRAFWEKPYILSAMARLMGYIIAGLKKTERKLPNDAKEYIKSEQINRLLNMIKLGKKMWRPD